MKNGFFDKINYSASNEDSESERKALRLNASDTVLCITGSGARCLDLLVDSPGKVISIDFNSTQNLLLELKIAAYKALNYNDFCEFIGIKHSSERKNIFQKIVPHLSVNANNYWTQHFSLIEEGVLYCGTWEKLLKSMLKMAYLRKGLIKALMQAPDLQTQQQIWNKQWSNVTWKLFLKVICNRFLWVHIIKEPGAQIIAKDFDVYAYIKQRLDFMANHFHFKTNHYANLIFNSGYAAECILPHHLRAENYELIKQNLHKIEIVTGSLNAYLQTCPDSISAFSLSDFSSYAPENVYNEIWENVINAATTNAKFCERQFLVKRNPELNFKSIIRNKSLENELFTSDEAAIYTFCVGQINK